MRKALIRNSLFSPGRAALLLTVLCLVLSGPIPVASSATRADLLAAAGTIAEKNGPHEKGLSVTGKPEPQAQGPSASKPLFDLGPPVADPERAWTLMVYLDADNDLEPFGIADINEMEIGVNGPVEVIVLIDRAQGYDTSNGDWTDARIYRIRKDTDREKIQSQVLAQPGELNMGDPEVLGSFLSAAIKTFPAKHYGLIMWDHGGGWASHAHDLHAPGSALTQDHLTLPELSGAIRGALQLSGLKRLDLVGFDMCLMAQLETAVELDGLAEVMIASQAVEPGDGWPYNEFLPEFGRGTSGARGLAATIVEKYAAFYRKKDTAAYTLSALDLTHTGKILQALDTLADRLASGMEGYWTTMSRALFFSESYAARTETQRTKHALASLDLIDALKRMQLNIADFPAGKELDALIQAKDRFVIAASNSRMHRLSNGIAIYGPVTGAIFNEEYRKTKFARISRWAAMVDKLHGIQARDRSVPVISRLQLVDWGEGGRDATPKPAATAYPTSTQGIAYTVDGRNVLWLYGMYGERSDDGTQFIVHSRNTVTDANWTKRTKDMAADKIDLLLPEYADGTSERTILFSGLRYAVSNGKETYHATVDIPLSGNGAMSVPIQYNHPATGLLGGTVHFAPKWWYAATVILELPQEDGSVLFRQIEPPPDAEITTLFEAVNATGEVSYLKGGTMKWGDGLELVLTLYQPGKYEVSLMAESIGGRSKPASYTFQVDHRPGAKELIEAGGNFTAQDLLGTWDYIQADRFRDAKEIVPLGVSMTVSPHPDPNRKDLFLTESVSQEKNIRIRSILFLDTRGYPHIRTFDLPEEGGEADPMSGDFSVYSIGVFKGQKTMMLLQNIANLGIFTAIKRDGSLPAQQGQGGTQGAQQQEQHDGPDTGQHPYQPGAGQAPPGVGLDGSWSSPDGTALVFQGEQYQFSEYGQVMDAGTMMIQGNTLITRSAWTGMAEQYLYQVQGSTLLLQDAYGETYQFSRGGGQASAQPDPVGRGNSGATSPEIMRVLAGSWKDIRSSGHTIITLNQDGTFAYYSDYAGGGNFTNQYGDATGSWGHGNQGGMHGRWAARGTPQQGTITYQSQNGEQGTLDYQVLVEKGQPFWNEFYFDGSLYSRQ